MIRGDTDHDSIRTTRRPASVAEAAKAASRAGNAKILAGGQSLLGAMKLGLAAPERWSTWRIARPDTASRSTAAPRHRRDDDARRGRRLARGAARHPGAGRARRRHRRPPGAQPRHDRRQPGQQRPGGRLSRPRCWASARRSRPTGAASRPTTSSRACTRRRSAEGEIITAVSFPIPKKAGWEKFKQPASRFSIVGVFVEPGRVGRARRGHRRRRLRLPRQGAGGQARRQLVAPPPATASSSAATG